MVNLIVRLPASVPTGFLFTGHYDTKLFREFQFVGASDGASSGAFLIELARVLKDAPHEFTYEIHLARRRRGVLQELDGVRQARLSDNTLTGAATYVQAAQKANAIQSMKAMILVDMIVRKTSRSIARTDNTSALLAHRTSSGRRAAKLGYARRVSKNLGGAIEDDSRGVRQVPACRRST
jgi:Zn-dependent M28 family amino/carboxypeptidase